MSEEASNEEIELAEEVVVSQAFVKDASHELSALLKDYAETCWLIGDLEKKTAEARKKRSELLKANPWLGNVQGTLNKEAFKMAKKAAIPPEVAEPSSDQMEGLEESIEKKEMIELIPKKKKKPPQKIEADKTPEATRARILKKSTKLDIMGSSSKKQFSPDHPAHQ